jgi:hypothetical protein
MGVVRNRENAIDDNILGQNGIEVIEAPPGTVRLAPGMGRREFIGIEVKMVEILQRMHPCVCP